MKINSILAPIVALSFTAFIAMAGESELVEVMVTGIGITQEAAIKAANRAAVQQVVGTIVDATTLVENDELVEDKILTYSPGLVSELKIIGTPKTENGIVTLTAKAIVKKTAIQEKLTAAKIISLDLDSDSIFAQALSAQDNLADAEAMIKEVLGKHTSFIVAETIPGKNGKTPIDYDPKTGETFVNVKVHINMDKYRQFVKEILDKLGPIAARKEEVQGKKDLNGSRFRLEFPVSGLNGYGKEEDFLPILIVNNAESGNATLLFFGKNEYEFVQSALCLQYHNLYGVKRIAVSASVLDSNNQSMGIGFVLASGKECRSDFWKSCFAVSRSIAQGRFFACVIAPLACYGSYANYSSPDFILLDGEKFSTETNLRISLGNFSPEQLRSAKKLEIKVGHMDKDGRFSE